MKAISKGRRYDTDTATKIVDVSPSGYGRNDYKYEETALYRTDKGAWFLAGHGGPMTRWSRPVGQSGRTGGKGILPIYPEEARELLEERGEVEVLETYFAKQIEDA